ncbi:EAL domain-containing protein [Thermomonas alba]|uniref:EAL domain-containing protein n=1 Tax=Thermomonas alba TaxID=2888525 RepID=UPI001F0504E6
MIASIGPQRKLALLHIDLDGVGSINATLGENIVERVLAVTAQRLQQAMPPGTWLWQLASEEFLAAIAYRDGEPDGEQLAECLREAFEPPVQVAPYSLDITLAIGLAVYPDHAHDAASLLAAAEQAMRRAKRAGPGGFSQFAPEPQHAAATDPLQGHRFVDAIARSEFRLYYQPTVSAQDGSIVSCSALLRWHNTQEGVLRASRVLPAVERAGLSAPVGLWTIETAMRQMRRWREQGIDYLTAAVPLDMALLTRRECPDLIGELFHRNEVPASAFEFEISEAALAMEALHLAGNLAALRAMGATLALADFGMRGLSLVSLARHPLDRLKIDRSFLREVIRSPRSAALVRAIIAMGHKLGMTVVAKGVETEAELGFLRRHHCDFFQGYLFSPPLPDTDIDELLRRRFLLPQVFQTGADQQPTRTLLLLDDEENVLRSLVRLLRRDGYRLLTASSVNEAFDLLARNDVQVIVSDQRMPDMSGTEFLGRVRDMYPDTIRLALSGYTDVNTISEAVNQGAVFRFLLKPWDDAELRGHIRAAFRLAEQRRAQVIPSEDAE